MDTPLWSFMKAFKVNDGAEKYTHTSQMYPQLGKFTVDHNHQEEFWRLYCDGLLTEGNQFMCGISESPNPYMPILVDIDLDWTEEEALNIMKRRGVKVEYNKNGVAIFNESIYTQRHIDKLIEVYLDVFRYCFQEYEASRLFCFVLEKSKPYNNGVKVKNGFHLHFPYCFVHQSEQENQIYPRVVKRLNELDLFADLYKENSGAVVDRGAVKKYWLMYGARKDTKLESYRLTRIVNFKGMDVDLETVMENNVIVNLDGKHIDLKSPVKKDDQDPGEVKPIEYFLPRILSVHSYERPISRTRCDLESALPPKPSKIKDHKKEIYENMPFQEMYDMVKKLMAMINSRRADNYDTWIEIGWILFNIMKGSTDEGLQLFLEFSKRTSRNNYNEATCVYHWNTMEVRSYTIGTLRHFAGIDNPQEYAKFMAETSDRHIKDSLDGGHADLAKCLYDIFANRFVCASIERKIWYEFKDHRWIRMDSGISLRQRIDSELVPKYKLAIQKCFENGVDSQSEEVQARHKKLNAILLHLKTAGFKDSIMKECQEKFYNGNFLERLDNDKYLVGFTNGVIDLHTLTFRDGRPEDYISMTTGYDYKEYKEDDPDVQEVNTIMIKIYPDPILKRYALEYFARLLKGGNDAKTFLCHCSSGNNGKSVMIELVEKALGNYMVKLPTALLTGKRGQSSQAAPELARTHGVKFAVLQEPDGNDTMNGGILKELTGNDTMFIRGLFQSGSDMKLLFKLSLITNNLPRIPADDQAIWNRVRVLPYQSLFPQNNAEVPLTWEEQMKKKIFYRDPTITEKFDILKPAFMFILFNTYKECMQRGWSDDPEMVTEATLKYRENNDYLLQFVNECIKVDPRPGCNIGINDLYNTFKSWFQMTYNNSVKMATKNEIKEQLLKKWGPMKLNKWPGKRLKKPEDEEMEGSIRVLREDDFTDPSTTDDSEGGFNEDEFY